MIFSAAPAFAGDTFIPASTPPDAAIRLINKATKYGVLPKASFNRGVEAYFQANSHRLSETQVQFLVANLKQTEILIPVPGPCCIGIRFDQNLTKNSPASVKARILDARAINDRREPARHPAIDAPSAEAPAAHHASPAL